MPIVSKVNQYPGANAHFQSYCQADNAPIFAGLNSHQRWRMFHSQYIAAGANVLSEQLEPFGYVAQVETSLQIREFDNETDVAIVYDPQPGLSYSPPDLTAPTPPLFTVPLDIALGTKEGTRLNSIAIQALDQNQSRLVAWIEILSPANKAGGRHAKEYAQKREDIVNLGIPLIEIDLLHKQPPVVGGLPAYCRWDTERAQFVTDPSAYPYLVCILGAALLGPDALVYPFAPGDPFPTIPLPLLDRTYPFDFGIPYHIAFAQSGNYRVVDYEEPPQQFGAFNERDQAIIRQRMGTIQQYVSKFGIDKLQEGPFPPLASGQEPPDLTIPPPADMEL